MCVCLWGGGCARAWTLVANPLFVIMTDGWRPRWRKHIHHRKKRNTWHGHTERLKPTSLTSLTTMGHSLPQTFISLGAVAVMNVTMTDYSFSFFLRQLSEFFGKKLNGLMAWMQQIYYFLVYDGLSCLINAHSTTGKGMSGWNRNHPAVNGLSDEGFWFRGILIKRNSEAFY